MNIESEYVLAELGGQRYLLPYGQNIAEFRPGIRLNESGAFIWNALISGKSEEELPMLLAAHYHASPDELPMLRTDVASFLANLRLNGIIDRPAPNYPPPSGPCGTFLIGTIPLRICLPEASIPEEFLPFSADECRDAQNVPSLSQDAARDSDGPRGLRRPSGLTVSASNGQPKSRPTGRLLVRNDEVAIIEHPHGYCLLFPGWECVRECSIDKRAENALFYARETSGGRFREELFHGIRFAYLLNAMSHGLFAVHSASISYRGKAWLFSAPAGTGKSTHAGLWQECYGVSMLNGDLNLIGIEDGTPICYGLPWCGTSGISTRGATPLGGIVFLRQSPENRVEHLSADRRALMMVHRMISPAWTGDMLFTCLDFAKRAASAVPCFLLYCNKERAAAAACKAAIDEAIAARGIAADGEPARD